MQQTLPGLLLYGVFVFVLEFAPLGGVNPKEVAEYFNTVRACVHASARQGSCA